MNITLAIMIMKAFGSLNVLYVSSHIPPGIPIGSETEATVKNSENFKGEETGDDAGCS